MWTRQELKEKGKAAFKGNYWKSVLVGLVVMVFGGTATYSVKESSESLASMEAQLNTLASQTGISLGTLIGMILGIVGVSLALGLAWSVFLRNPLLVGTKRYFLKNAEQPADLKELGYAFQGSHYMRILAARFLADLFIFLWSLLLIIPGIIKHYQYYLVSYILADDPEMPAMDALRMSREMMKGHKWSVFVLDLSFIGWNILGVLTCGILNIFYVTPYIEATGAELYRTLKPQYR